MRKEILSLIGCGWLGIPLASSLLAASSFSIVATARKKPMHLPPGVDFFPLNLTLLSVIPPSMASPSLLIYLVPPLPFLEVKHFFDQVSPETPLIFISSISVYGKGRGEVDETAPVTLGTPLCQAEDYVRARFKKATILRLGGLYGEKRHPLFSLQGKKDLKNGQEYLHLVHQGEVISAILGVIQKGLWGEVINIVGTLKMAKEEYYTTLAKKWGLVPPLYSLNEEAAGEETLISNEKSKRLLGLTYSNPCDFTPAWDQKA